MHWQSKSQGGERWWSYHQDQVNIRQSAQEAVFKVGFAPLGNQEESPEPSQSRHLLESIDHETVRVEEKEKSQSSETGSEHRKESIMSEAGPSTAPQEE